MAMSYPSNPPSGYPGLRNLRFQDRDAVDLVESPFSFAAQAFQDLGAALMAVLSFTTMERADAEDWIGWRKGLYSSVGYFELGDPVNVTPRGSWAGQTPKVSGAHAAGITTLALKNMPDGTTWKRGDKFEVTVGGYKRLHMAVKDGSLLGSPSAGSIEIWPPTRAALADGDSLTLASPQGTWRLAPGNGDWTLDPDAGFVLSDLRILEYLV